MNRSIRRAQRSASRATLETQLQETIAARNSLLDIVNVLLTREHGKVEIPADEMAAATRHFVDVTRRISGRGGDRFVIELRGYEPPARSRLERLGLRLPT